MKHPAVVAPVRRSGSWLVLATALLLAPLFFPTSVLLAQSGGTNLFIYSFDPTTTKLQITPQTRWMIFRPTDAIGIASSAGGNLRVVNLAGQLIYSGGNTNLYLPVGHYFVETPGDRSQFVVLPANWPAKLHVGWCGAEAADTILPRADLLNLEWIRIRVCASPPVAGGTNWTWSWPLTDANVQNNTGKRKILADLQFDMTSNVYNSATQTYTINQAEFLRDYSNYVYAVAARYGTSFDTVQVWNEPSTANLPVANWAGMAPLLTQMINLTRAAFLPSVKITAPVAGSPDPSLLQSIVTAGGATNLDYNDFHDYGLAVQLPDVHGIQQGVASISALTIPERIQAQQQVLAKPMIVSELSLQGTSALGITNPAWSSANYDDSWWPLTWQQGMWNAIKYAVMYREVNAILLPDFLVADGSLQSNHEIYGYDAPPNIAPYDIYNRGPHPKTSAFLMSYYWINDAVFVGKRAYGGSVWLYAYQRTNDNTSLVFAWTTQGNSQAINPNSGLTALDIFGNSIQPAALVEQPILFTSTTATASNLLTSVVNALSQLPNRPPVWQMIPSQTVYPTQTLTFTVTATDPDYDPIAYTVTGLPAGASFNASTGGFAWTPTTSQTGTFTVNFIATDVRGLAATNSAIITVVRGLTDGMLGWWKFDEGSGAVASDSAANNPGTLNGSPSWTTGVLSNALSFNGASQYVQLGAGKLTLTNNFTVAAWLNPTDLSTTRYWFALRSVGSNSLFACAIKAAGIQVEGITTTGAKLLQWGDTGGNPYLSSNRWYHVAVVYDQGQVSVYLNSTNQPVAFTGNPNWGASLLTDPNAYGWFAGTPYYNFAGKMDDVRVYSRALTPVEISSLYSGTGTGQPPVFSSSSTQSVVAGLPLSFTVAATDPQGLALTYSASGLPVGASFNTASHAFSWTPTLSQTGTVNVAFLANDGPLTATQTVAIAVAVNQPPVFAAIGAKSGPAGQLLSFTVSATDAENQPLTYSASGLPAGATFTAGTRTFSWTPSVTQTGVFAVVFSVSDGLQSTSSSVNITISPQPQPPVFAALGNQSVVAGFPLSFTVSATDPQGWTLTYSASGLPVGASFNTASHAFSWTPSLSQTGTVNVAFLANDGPLTATQTVAIAVAVNQPPVFAAIGAKSGPAGQLLSFTVSATDAENQPLTYSASGLPAGATFTAGTQTFSWTPSVTQTGVFAVVFSVSDGLQSTSSSVNITISPQPQPPVFAALGNQSVVAGFPLSFTVSATDPQGWTLTYSASGLPVGASFNTASHAFSWTPSLSQTGTVNVAFLANDGLLTATQTVAIAVAVNQPPVFAAIGAKSGPAGQLLSFTVSATDAENQPLTYSASGLPTGATFTAGTRTFSWTPSVTQTGVFAVVFSVSDGLQSTSSSVNITISPQPQPPVFAALGNQSVVAGFPLSFTVSATDPQGWTLTYSASGLPVGASFNTASHAFSWTPSLSQTGTVNVAFLANDGPLTATQTVAIAVAVNQPPVFAAIGAKSGPAGQLLSFTVSATDAENQPLTYSASGLPTGATFTAGTRTFSWTPSVTQTGVFAVVFSVSDGLQSTSSSVNITISPQPQPPVFAALGNQSVVAGFPLSFTVSATDPQGWTLTYSASGLPVGASFNTASHAFSWTPSLSQTGTVNVAFLANDGPLTATQTVAIAVAVNQPPVFAAIGAKSGPAGQLLSFTVSATDAENQPLTYSASGLPAGATFTAGTQTFSWTPAVTQTGVFAVVFSVSDGLQSTSSSVNITISPQPQPPVFAALGNQSVVAGFPLSFTVSATDPQGWTLTYSASGLPVGASFNTASHAFSWTPTLSQTGTVNVAFLANDGPLTATQTVAIAVAVNQPPVFAAIGAKSGPAGQLLSFTVSATDAENQPLTYSASGLPTGATFTAGTRTFSWTPSVTQTGVFAVVFSVSDGLQSTSSSVNITISAQPQPPVFAALGNQSVVAGFPLSFTVSATDPQGWTLTYSASGLPVGASFNTASHAFSWTPTLSQTGTVNVAFLANDGPLTATQTVAIVVAVNQPPVFAAIGAKSGPAGQLLSFTVSATDAENQPLTYSASGLPTGATFTAGTRTFSWTPSVTQTGVFAVVFSVSDGLQSTSSSVNITISAQPQPPVFAALGNQSVVAGFPLSFTVSATDPQGLALTYSASGLPVGASFNTASHAFSWTPSLSQTGTVNVAFLANDGPLTATQTVAIAVAVNQPPVFAAIGAKSGPAGQLLSFTVSATDAENQPLTYSASGLPAGATFTAGMQTFSWTPSVTQTGVFAVVFSVSDGLQSTSSSVNITISAQPQPPVFAALPGQSVVAGSPLSFTVSATDPQGSPLTYSASGLPSGASFDTAAHAFSWTPSLSQTGTVNAAFIANDGTLSATQTVAIAVAVNQPPVFAAIGAKSGPAGQLLSFTVSATDAENQPLTYSASGLPAGATFTAGTQTFNWTPSVTQTGVFAVVFSVSDGLQSTSSSVNITISAQPQPPVFAALPGQSVVAGSPLSFTVSAIDPQGSPLTYSASGLPSGASFDTAAHAFNWTPSLSQTDTVSVAFLASDGSLTATQTVAIAVVVGTAGSSAPPTLGPVSPLDGVVGQTISFKLAGSSPSGLPLTYSINGLPAGAALDAVSGVFSWTPTMAQVGAYSLSASVSDGYQAASVLVPVVVLDPSWDWLAGAKLFAYRIINNQISVCSWKLPDQTALVIAWCVPGYTTALQPIKKLPVTDLYNQPVATGVLGSQADLFHSGKRVSPLTALQQVTTALGY